MTSHTHAPQADVSVRPATANDAPAVGAVQATVWQDAFAPLLPQDVLASFDAKEFAATWRRTLAQPTPGHLLLVALQGAQVVGYAAWGTSPDTDPAAPSHELLLLGVHPAARRQGHGSRLLRAVVDTVREAGASDLGVWVPEGDQATGEWLVGAGLIADGARRVRAAGDAELPEVRLTADIGEPRDEAPEGMAPSNTAPADTAPEDTAPDDRGTPEA